MTTKEKVSLLMIDNQNDLQEVLQNYLEDRYEPHLTCVESAEIAIIELEKNFFDIVVINHELTKDIFGASKKLRTIKSDISIIYFCDENLEYPTEISVFPKSEILIHPFSGFEFLDRVKKLLDLKNITKIEKNEFRLESGETLIKEGDHGSEIYLLKSGVLSIQKKIDDTLLEVATIKAGEIVGELGSFKKNTRSATVIAKTQCDIMIIPKEKVSKALQVLPKWFEVLFETLVRRLDQTTNDLIKEKIKNTKDSE